MKRKLTFIAITLIAFALNLSAKTIEDTVVKSFDFKEDGTIQVQNRNGKITVEGWDKNEVKIEAIKRVRSSSKKRAEKYMEEIEIRMEKEGDEIFIETDLPSRHSGMMDWAFGNKTNGSVEYLLWVPKKSNLKMRSSNGSVNVYKVDGMQRLETTNGKIVAEDVAGSVDAHTTNGSIRARLVELDEGNDLGFYTTNGSIKVYLPKDVKLDVRASTTNGSIDTDFDLVHRGRYNSKRIRGKINGGGALLELSTTNGSIKIYED